MEDKREKILDAALKLFVCNGFHDTPTSLIAKEAGVANGTLFHYFRTKDELINTLYKEMKNRFFSETTSQVQENDTFKMKMRTAWFATVFWAFENKMAYLFIQRFFNSPFISKLTIEEVSDNYTFYLNIIDEGKEKNIIKNQPTDFLYQLTTFNVDAMIHYAYKKDELDKELIELSFDNFWDSIKKT